MLKTKKQNSANSRRRKKERASNMDDAQSKMTEYFPTVSHNFQRGAKRMKLETPVVEAEPDVKSPSFNETTPFYACDTFEAQTLHKISNAPVTPDKASGPVFSEPSPRFRRSPHRIESSSSSARRCLRFCEPDEEESLNTQSNEKPAEQMPNEAVSRSTSMASKANGLAGLISARLASHKNIASGPKSVAELQKSLSAHGTIRNVHLQNQSVKCVQIADVALVYASPTKVPKNDLFSPKKATQDDEDKDKGLARYQLLPSCSAVPQSLEVEGESDSEFDPLDSGQASRLVQAVKNSVKMPLPTKYERLVTRFQYLEKVVAVFYSQKKRMTFVEVAGNVKTKMKSDFTVRHFGQILYVYPASYNVRQEECWAPIGGIREHSTEFELVIEPNLISDLVGYMCSGSPCKAVDLGSIPLVTPTKLLSPIKGCSPSRASSFLFSPVKNSAKRLLAQPRPPLLDERPRIQAWRTVARLSIFKHLMQEIVKKEHILFLESIGISLPTDQEGQLRFHPDFNIDLVSDIPEADLPKLPKGDDGLNLSMRNYMKSVQDSINTLPQKIQKVIEELRSPEKQAAFAKKVQSELSPPTKISTGNSKGNDLLERIRKKEQLKKQMDMFRDPKMEQRIAKLEKISRSLLRIILSAYTLERTGSFKLHNLVEKLNFSSWNRSYHEMEEHIVLLCEVASDYFSMTNVCGEKYVQLKMNDFVEINKIVNGELEKCSNFYRAKGNG